jgi:hypothetical protein
VVQINLYQVKVQVLNQQKLNQLPTLQATEMATERSLLPTEEQAVVLQAKQLKPLHLLTEVQEPQTEHAQLQTEDPGAVHPQEVRLKPPGHHQVALHPAITEPDRLQTGAQVVINQVQHKTNHTAGLPGVINLLHLLHITEEAQLQEVQAITEAQDHGHHQAAHIARLQEAVKVILHHQEVQAADQVATEEVLRLRVVPANHIHPAHVAQGLAVQVLLPADHLPDVEDKQGIN